MTDWTIRWRGHEWTDSDLTGEILATLAIISGDDRFDILHIDEEEVREYPSLGFMRLINMIAAFATVTACDGLNGTEANDAAVRVMTEIQKASAEEILGAVTFGASQLVTA